MVAEEVKCEPVMVTITKEEYDRLLADSKWLSCLEAAGVVNWEGCDLAANMFNEDQEDEND